MWKSHNVRLRTMLALVATFPVFVALVAYAEEPDEIHFHDSYEAAIREAKQTQKPIFLEFRCAP